jgi:hypothetical protein
VSRSSSKLRPASSGVAIVLKYPALVFMKNETPRCVASAPSTQTPLSEALPLSGMRLVSAAEITPGACSS